jgi:transcriptional regulator with XRE-family HTH domain
MTEDPGKQIKKLRLEKGLSQDRFGHKIGLSGKTISAYETGKITPSLKVLERISQTYNVTISTPNLKTKKMVVEKLQQIQVQIKDIENSLRFNNK